MELKKANLHMDQIKCQANTQITLEEDKNISDRNPDAADILMEQGRIILEEVRAGKDIVFVKGKMLYEVLYISDEDQGRIYRIQGELPLEEKIRVEGMDTMDNPRVRTVIEDLRSGLINSRKINIRCLINFCVEAKEIRDEEILLEIMNQDNIEVKKEGYEQSVIAMERKDVFRIKEDLELPSTLPSVQEVLWKYLDLEKWEIKTLENQIGIQGELNLFILYEGTDGLIKSYETRLPFSGNIECPGCNGNMMADIMPEVNNWNISIKQDYDGEDRVIEVEMVLDIPIQLYENREMEMITDVYGTSQNAKVEYEEACGKRFRDKYQTKVKLNEIIKLSTSEKIIQICHIQTKPTIEDTKLVQEGLRIDGITSAQILYLSDKEKKPYEVIKKDIPFSYVLENADLSEQSQWKIQAFIEQCSGIILDEDRMELKITIALELIMADCWKNMRIKNIRMEPYSKEYMEEMPGIIVYIPNDKEELWEVGKKYAISADSIKNMNQLTKTEIEKGQKILLVKDLS